MKWYYVPDKWVWTGDRNTATGRISTFEPVWIPCEIIRNGRKRVRIKPEYGYVEKWVYPMFVRNENDKPYQLGSQP